MSQRSAPRVIGVGAIFIDDIVLPDGITYMGQLGGGVVHALMGAVVCGERPGLVALAGQDLPESIRQFLDKHVDTTGLHLLDVPQIRAWQLFEQDGTRRELYRVAVTRPFIHGAQPQHLPASYQQREGCYLLQDFDGIRAWCTAVEGGITLWEPLQQIMIPDNRPLLREVLESYPVDVVSPNLAEAQAVYEITGPEALVEALLNDGAQAVALRMGAAGSLIADRHDTRCHPVPAVPVDCVIDQTGAGNTYCGGMLAGLVQGKSLEQAAMMGAVAASFCIECQGVLNPELVTQTDYERRLRQIAN